MRGQRVRGVAMRVKLEGPEYMSELRYRVKHPVQAGTFWRGSQLHRDRATGSGDGAGVRDGIYALYLFPSLLSAMMEQYRFGIRVDSVPLTCLRALDQGHWHRRNFP